MGYERRYGDIPGFPPGTPFDSRQELYDAGLHDHLQAGISGQGDVSADAIVLSGGYPDGDQGDEITYTGQGGRDTNKNKRKRKQIADQSESSEWNKALINSEMDGSPVRVIRGSRSMTGSKFGPTSGYKYAGLYRVVEHWFEAAGDGTPFKVLRFRMVKIGSSADAEDQALFPTPSTPFPASSSAESASGSADAAGMTHEACAETEVDPGEEPGETGRSESRADRLNRLASNVRTLKRWYGSECQFCGTRVELPHGPYAEGAHIHPLGKRHKGPDWTPNMLCLCPTCHVRFDYGAIYLTDDFKIVDRTQGSTFPGPLRQHHNHEIKLKYIRYHRIYIAKQAN